MVQGEGRRPGEAFYLRKPCRQVIIYGWLYLRCANEHDKEAVRARMLSRINFVDLTVWSGKKLGNLDLDIMRWEDPVSVDKKQLCQNAVFMAILLQDALHNARKELATHNIYLRPKIFHPATAMVARPQAEADSSVSEELSSSPGNSYTPTETLFLNMAVGATPNQFPQLVYQIDF